MWGVNVQAGACPHSLLPRAHRAKYATHIESEFFTRLERTRKSVHEFDRHLLDPITDEYPTYDANGAENLFT